MSRRSNSLDVAPSGRVRGYHRDCPAAERPGFGTYALVPSEDGTRVECEACGETDLVRVKGRWEVADDG